MEDDGCAKEHLGQHPGIDETAVRDGFARSLSRECRRALLDKPREEERKLGAESRALRSSAEVGLSARTREGGHCTNAGGLSAV